MAISIEKTKIFSKIFILTIWLLILSNTPSFAYAPDAANFNNIGISYTKTGDYPKAVEYFKKALENDPSLTNAYYNLGSVYKHTGEKDKAIKAFQLLLRNNPSDDEAAYLLATLYFEKQDYEKSLMYLNSIDKTSASYKDSLELFKKINRKINDSVINDTKPVNLPKLAFSGFSGPTGLAEDSLGNLYVANFLTNSIHVMFSDGKIKTTIKNELINGPVGIAVDSKDNLFVANYTSNNVVKIDKTGTVKVILRDVVKPYYLYFNRAGVLYVSEQENNTVIRIGIPE